MNKNDPSLSSQPSQNPDSHNSNHAQDNKETIRFEFVALMALIMSIGALATDTLLPALGVIGQTFGVSETSDKQLLVTMVFLGMGLGQMFAGALSDALGRKPIMYLGFGVFILASLMSVLTSSFEMLVLSRFLQGFGLSAPRTISTAIIRDSYSGDYMAKIMSFVAMTFLVVPAVSPLLGSVLLQVWQWQAIFYMQAVVAIVAVLWFGLRQAETLAKSERATLNMAIFSDSLRMFFSHKKSVIYTLGMGFAMGAFMTFLSTGETILIGQYGKQAQFPYLFGSIALAMGVAMMVNGKLVVGHGMHKMVSMGSVLFTLVPLGYLLLMLASGHSGHWASNPTLSIFMLFMMLQVFAIGFVFGNLTALSLEPLGKIAGMATAISGLLSTLIAVVYAGVIGHFMVTSALPLFVGFFVAGVLLLGCLWLAGRVER